jgi:hypothetical protein
MTKNEQSALLLEALSDKVLHQLPPAVWRGLFLGAERDSIRFERRHLTLVHADAEAQRDGPDDGALYQELQRLNARHNGRLDPYVDAAALATFENPGAAVRMALELQRAAEGTGPRIGVVTGLCTLAYFRVQGRLWCTPLGEQPQRAARVAASAPPGGVVVSPETCSGRAGQHDASEGPDFGDSEVDLSSLAFDTAIDGIDIRC